MDVIEAITTRRSIRKYLPGRVPENVINEILDAGRLAPSGHNSQPTRYVLIESDEMKYKLRAEKVFCQDFVYDAPLILVMCGRPSDYDNWEGARYQQEEGSLPEDLAEAMEMCRGRGEEGVLKNIGISSAFAVLRAMELGLGSCYVGLLNREKLKKILGIAEKYIVPFAITFGYPAESPSRRERKPLHELILGRF